MQFFLLPCIFSSFSYHMLQNRYQRRQKTGNCTHFPHFWDRCRKLLKRFAKLLPFYFISLFFILFQVFIFDLGAHNKPRRIVATITRSLISTSSANWLKILFDEARSSWIATFNLILCQMWNSEGYLGNPKDRVSQRMRGPLSPDEGAKDVGDGTGTSVGSGGSHRWDSELRLLHLCNEREHIGILNR